MKGKRFAAVCAVMIGLTAALAGCGAKKAEAAEAAPLVKTMTVGAEEQAARRSFPARCTDIMNQISLSRSADGSRRAM